MMVAVPQHVCICDAGEVRELLISCSWKMPQHHSTLWLPVVEKIESLMEFSLHLWSNQCTNGT